MNEPHSPDSHSLWYKDAIIYQLHVKSFYDGKQDGIGDFLGLTRKLDYLASLGITAIWLLPFYPSPLRDDGYDIAEYFDVNPHYGSMAEFKAFLEAAHSRGIRVVTELVLNHTSDQHTWFQKSRHAKPGSYWRDFYVWSDTKDRYREARIIFKDFETSNWAWDPVAGAFYWHRFYAHQPDLNFENVNVHKALFKVIDFWFNLGVDGLRLDAVPYLYEQEGTNCENLPQTFAFLKKLRAHVEQKFPDRMLLAEANQWPEDAAAYFGNGDMCHMAFHFPLMPRMFMALQMEDRFPILDILEQTPAIPESAQWAIFLRNHDELTLEMVSEEERDFMYRTYARDMSSRINLGIRRRLAPLLQNSRRRLELLNVLLFSLPGTPVIYYGDEIGMGDNHFLGDRDGVRTPMQWSSDRNAGFSLANPQQLFLPVIIDPEYHYQSVNVENEERNLSSLLWWMRRAIAMRRSFPAFSRGGMEPVRSSNACVLSFVRRHGDEAILVIVNLSRFSQAVTLDLSAYAGATPVDVFSGNPFPRISTAAYPMTLGFHDYFWLHLKPDLHADPRTESYRLPHFSAGTAWTALFEGESAKRIAATTLPAYLQQRTTAGCQNKPIQQTAITDRLILSREGFQAVILLVRVRYAGRDEDLLLLPLTMEPQEKAAAVIAENQGLILGRVDADPAAVIYDCAYHPEFQVGLLELILGRRSLRGLRGDLAGETPVRRSGILPPPTPPVRLIKAGRRNVCTVSGETYFLKLFRRAEEGQHPEIELNRLLAEKNQEMVARHLGSLTYRSGESVYGLGLCTEHFQHSRTLWNIAVDAVSKFLEESLATASPEESPREPLAGFEKKIRRTGSLTARMHRALAAEKDERYRPEAFNAHYQRSLYHALRGLTHRAFTRMEGKLDSLGEGMAREIRDLLPRRKEILAVFSAVLRNPLTAGRMRIHGDFNLGQIMVMDEQYRICDFEGNPSLPLGERRLKRSPLRDVASMAHSLYGAAYYALFHTLQIQDKDRQLLAPKAGQWAKHMTQAYLQDYFADMGVPGLVAGSEAETRLLTKLYLFERVLFDIEKAFNFDQADLAVNIRCLLHYLEEAAAEGEGRK